MEKKQVNGKISNLLTNIETSMYVFFSCFMDNLSQDENLSEDPKERQSMSANIGINILASIIVDFYPDILEEDKFHVFKELLSLIKENNRINNDN